MPRQAVEIIVDSILFIFAILAISFFYANNLLLTAVLLVILIATLKVWYRPRDIHFFIAAVIVGPIAEIVAVHFGAWQYTNSTVLGIPLWLPLAWGLIVVLIKRLAGLRMSL